jgi:hypothetical protein
MVRTAPRRPSPAAIPARIASKPRIASIAIDPDIAGAAWRRP